MREINEKFENNIMPVFKKTSDFKQRLKEFNMIPCSEQSRNSGSAEIKILYPYNEVLSVYGSQFIIK